MDRIVTRGLATQFGFRALVIAAQGFTHVFRVMHSNGREIVTARKRLMTFLWHGAGTAGVLVVTAMPAIAQEPFADVQNVVRPGDTVFLIDDTGTEVRGKVAGVGPSALRLTVNGTEREWSAPSIWRVTRRGDSLKNGTTIGLVTGSVIGGIGGLAWASLLRNEGHDGAAGFLFLLAIGGGGGAGIGAGFDALIRGRTLIYQQRSNGVTLVPVVTPRTQAMQLGVSF
jgi:hypothetical protein